MAAHVPELTVFPTELSLRWFQEERALAEGWVDASGQLTFARLRGLCLPHAACKGTALTPAKHLVFRHQVVQVARGHFTPNSVLGRLSDRALGDVLDGLLKELAALPQEAGALINWLLEKPKHGKLHDLGTLISVWRAVIRQEGFADALDMNQAILRLLRGDREKWPPLLRDARRIVFRSVRWFTPFEECCVAALNQRMKVRLESALPAAHADLSADRLGLRVRAEIMSDPWAAWAEDLGDALAVDSPDILQLDDPARIEFSRSAGRYGEIEDLARRIAYQLEQTGIAPNRMALVVPNLGPVQDIIPHVFSRFRIPYYFRRGRPVLSSPTVKAGLAWLAFPLHGERDVLIDLVRNPAIRMKEREGHADELQHRPPILAQKEMPWHAAPGTLSTAEARDIFENRLVEPEDHFNKEALAAVGAALEGLGEVRLPLDRFLDLLEELLENETVRPRESHDQGVWILNPHDAVGLQFDVVLFAGLNEGEFPAVPQQDALLSDAERYHLRQHLEDRGSQLPRMALASADIRFEQQSVLFLAALGMAREQLVLSCRAVDQEGNEISEGEYYRKLWMLAGWPAQREPVVGIYTQWRMQQAGPDNIWSTHLRRQETLDPEDREPMPGESFLQVVPPSLCRAADEALQTATAQAMIASIPEPDVPREDDAPVVAPINHLTEMLRIEAERLDYLDAPVERRQPSIFCGHMPNLKGRIEAWFAEKSELGPTALETLAHNRYVFLLERIFGMREARAVDDTPDPLDRGRLMHDILREIYTVFAAGEPVGCAPRCWAVKGSDGWRLRNEDGLDAVPLVVFRAAEAERYLELARDIAERRLSRARLGHSGVWAAEREKYLSQILNIVRYDLETAEQENRYPALFEYTFRGEASVGLQEIQVGGTIDRVDLLFEDSGNLRGLWVLDYKGSSSRRGSREEYVRDVQLNLNCQLPVYGFAAQRFFFDAFNTPNLNAMTEAGYLFFERTLRELKSNAGKSLLPLDEEGMISGFLDTLARNLTALKNCDFAVDPLVEGFTDYRAICRTEALSRDELE